MWIVDGWRLMEVEAGNIVHRSIWVIHLRQHCTGMGRSVSTECDVRSTTEKRFSTGLCTTLDGEDEFGHLVVDVTTLLHERRDLFDGVHDRGVVASAELSRYRGVRKIS